MPAPHPAPHPAIALLAHESRTRAGPVPRRLGDRDIDEGERWLVDDAFLMRSPSGLGFLYRKGEGVTVERPAGCDPAEEALWLSGSVYAAIACINGLRPIHASAVAHGGRVYAFSGPSGAGKSTLIAALGQRGLAMFCDDTLVLDIAQPERIVCLPGHKRLKLTPQALALTGAAAQEKVALTIDKHYADPPAGSVGQALPLGELIFLETGDPPAIAAIAGAARFARLGDDHYTTSLFAQSRRDDPAARFALQSRLARHITMARFTRPRDPARFAEGVDTVLEYVKQR